MSYTVEAGWQHDYPDVAAALQQHIPVGTVMDVDHASGYSAVRSFVAAERAGVIEQKLDQVLARIGQPPVIDVNALAAAIAPHLTAGATADVIAAAVLHHLSADTANG